MHIKTQDVTWTKQLRWNTSFRSDLSWFFFVKPGIDINNEPNYSINYKDPIIGVILIANVNKKGTQYTR